MTAAIEHPLTQSDLGRVKRCWRCTATECNGLSTLLKMARGINLTEETGLFGPGQNPEMIYLVVGGVVGLLMADGRGGETLVKIVDPGSFVGESLMLTRDAERFSARTLTPARVAEIPAAGVRAAIEDNPCFRRYFFGALSDGLRRSVRQFAQLKLMTAPQRLGAYLLSVASCEHGPARLKIPFERQALAEMLGMRPESLSRAFRSLAEIGVARQERGMVAIEAIERLAAYCETAPAQSAAPAQAVEDGARSWKKSRPSPGQASGLGVDTDIPLFSMLSEVEIASVLAKSRVVTYDQPTLLFESGSPADRCFVVVAGRVRLFITKGDGREAPIDSVEPGASFAEAAMLGVGRYPVSAETQPGTRLLHIPKESLTGLLFKEALFARPLLEALARRQKQLFEWIMEFKTRTPTERLVRELLKLTEVESGSATIRLTMSKAALACHLGVAAESLSRIFLRLQPLGVKTGHASKVVVSDVAVLRDFCAQPAAEPEPAHA